MPMLLPTPEEMARLTPRQKDKARRAIWKIITETDQHIERTARRVSDAAAFGEAVREHARALERYMPREPAWITSERQRLLLEATS
jgi:hypothetical protein